VIAAFFGADESVAGRFIEGLNYSEMLHCRGLPLRRRPRIGRHSAKSRYWWEEALCVALGPVDPDWQLWLYGRRAANC